MHGIEERGFGGGGGEMFERKNNPKLSLNRFLYIDFNLTEEKTALNFPNYKNILSHPVIIQQP